MAERGFWSLARAFPSERAVDDRTAGELLAESNRLVHALRALGLRPGHTVAAALPEGFDLLALALASLQAGWYFAPLSPRLSEAELAARRLEAGIFFSARQIPPGFDRAESWSEFVASQSADPPEDRRAGQLLFYTSGTTGSPRPVRRTPPEGPPEILGKLAAVHLNAVCGLRPRCGAVHLVASPLYHSASLLWALDQLHLGHRLVLGGPFEANRVLGLIERERVTTTLMVPTHFRRLLALPDHRRYDVSSLRQVIHTGAACPVELKQRMLDWWGDVIYEVYGASEAAGTRATPADWRRKPGTVGPALGRVRVLRPDGSACAPLEVGEVHLQAPRHRGGFFAVGDRGYLDEDDYLFLCGRADDTIISGGVNIIPAEIESALRGYPGLTDLAVLGVPDDDLGQRVQVRVEGEVDRDELLAHCRRHLSCRFELVLGPIERDELGKRIL